MERYLRYGLVLFAIWIIATRIMSLIYLSFRDNSLLISYAYYFIGVSIIIDLLAIVTSIVIFIELSGTGRGMRRIAMTCLGLMLILVVIQDLSFLIIFNIIIPGFFASADSQTILTWIINGLRAAHGVTALLILVSLQEKGSVARMGLFLYSIVTIAGVAFQFFGMGGNAVSRAVLAILGIVSAVLILKRM